MWAPRREPLCSHPPGWRLSPWWPDVSAPPRASVQSPPRMEAQSLVARCERPAASLCAVTPQDGGSVPGGPMWAPRREPLCSHPPGWRLSPWWPDVGAPPRASVQSPPRMEAQSLVARCERPAASLCAVTPQDGGSVPGGPM
ncbi:hypothetical protein NDU88_002582 [Pleurodeles waltl]|uniref:Uncharacterized protein n=1 Tax=Pleurodeles waltl TaxID=8319 RepID=A0AAV7Q9A5_PLEWA|nr:hypothetical protein NDU88_002582 [Pleurodeles waltl]